MSLHKKTIAIVILTILASAYMVPVFVFAETPVTDICDTNNTAVCWPQKMCSEKGGNWAQTPDSKTKCGAIAECYKKNNPQMPAETLANVSSLGYCYTKPPTVNLQIKIGGANTAAGLTDYIPKIYAYLVSIVSIIAVVMIMVGGLRYLTAGGNPSAISSAKETITGAIIGLFLTFGSYIILQTINPALVQLKMPDIKMVRSSPLIEDSGCGGKTGGVALGQKCNSTCDCKQGKCIPFESGALEDFIKAVGYGTSATLSLMTLGGGSVAAGAGKVLVFTKGAVSALTKFAVKNPALTTGAAAGYTLYEFASGSGGQPGICIIEADHNVPAGAWCEKDEHCASGKCIVIPSVGTGLGTIAGGKGIGVCASGKVGSACECPQTGVCADTGGCDAGLSCVDNSDGKYTKSCTDGKAESPCYSNTDCKVAGYTCQLLSPANTKKCLSGSAVNYNTSCTTSVACQSAGSAWSCVKGFCSNGKDGGNCDVFAASQGNLGACSGGYTCTFYSDTQASRAELEWVENTGNKNDYPDPYQDEWETASDKPHGFQCKPKDFYVPVSKLTPLP